MSGEFAELLRRRAEAFLREARRLLEEGEHDLAAFTAEQAVQLYLKAVMLRLLGEAPRMHSVRGLLGRLATRLREEGFVREAEELEGFAGENRDALAALEDAYVDSRYAPKSFERREAERLVATAERLIGLLRGVERGVLG